MEGLVRLEDDFPFKNWVGSTYPQDGSCSGSHEGLGLGIPLEIEVSSQSGGWFCWPRYIYMYIYIDMTNLYGSYPVRYALRNQLNIQAKSSQLFLCNGAKAEKAMEPLGMSLGHDYMGQVTQCGISLRGLACTPPKTNRSPQKIHGSLLISRTVGVFANFAHVFLEWQIY